MLRNLLLASVISAASPMALATGPAACGPREYLVEQLAEQYGERQVVVGLVADGQLMELFASPGNDWTLVATRPDGVSCVVATGVYLTIAPAEDMAPSGDPA